MPLHNNINEDYFSNGTNAARNQINLKYKGNSNTDNWQPYRIATGGGFNAEGMGMVKVIVPAGTELWKCTSASIKPGPNDRLLSEWWCAANPFLQQTDGIRLMVEEAALNGVPFDVFVRVASCVKVEWNTLDKLQLIKLLRPATAIWGKFAPMKVHSSKHPTYWRERHDSILHDMATRGYDVSQGTDNDVMLGGMETYQLFIPALHKNHISVKSELPVRDVDGIKKLLGLKSLPSGPKDLKWRRPA